MNNIKYRIENKYGITPNSSWIRIENPTGYYEALVGLDKINDDEYEYRISGYFRPILDGEYKLIRKDIAEIILKYASKQVELKNIKICRKSTGEFWTDYYEIKALNNFNNSEYDDIKCEGIMIFGIQNEIYLSQELKNFIENDFKSDEIEFRIGPILMA